jgi:predicted DsbA family dithiol-disulfide isomerase
LANVERLACGMLGLIVTDNIGAGDVLTTFMEDTGVDVEDALPTLREDTELGAEQDVGGSGSTVTDNIGAEDVLITIVEDTGVDVEDTGVDVEDALPTLREETEMEEAEQDAGGSSDSLSSLSISIK